jgi:hypothetical protein
MSVEKQTLPVFISRFFPLILLFQGEQHTLQAHLSYTQQTVSYHP